NGQNYHMSSANAVYFNSEAAAQAAGYRKSLR
ncbi:DNA-entry nuclease, partial [Lactobacillus crispatus]